MERGMLFADNNQTFCVPFNNYSVFLKFFELRNTDKPAVKPVPMLEVKVMKDGNEEFRESHNLMEACFINPALLISLSNTLSVRHSGFDANSDHELSILVFSVKLAPGLYMRIGNNYNKDDKEFRGTINDFVLSKNPEPYNNLVIASTKDVDLKMMAIIIDEYNRYLFNTLCNASMWGSYCAKYKMNELWQLPEFNVNKLQLK